MSEASSKKTGRAKPKLRAVDPNDPEIGWQTGFLVDQYGKPKACARTLGLIVRHWPPFEGLRLNELTLEVEQHGEVVTEGKYFRWREQIEAAWRFPVPPEVLQDAVAAVAEEHTYHPVRDYLDGLEWDETHRLHAVAPEILDCHDALAARFIMCWMTGAVARIYRPGCQLDNVLTLFSAEQGRKKTSFYRDLFGPGWWTVGDLDPSNKDTLLVAHQHWGVVLDEVEELTKGPNRAAITRCITNPEDSIRAPYERRASRRKRRFVFAATTNEREFLTDPTGSRRWWVIDVGPADPTARMAKLAEWRDQLWAESKYRFQMWAAGDQAFEWWLTPEEEKRREQTAKLDHQRREIVHEQVETYIARQAPHSELRIAEILEFGCRIPSDRVAKESGLARKVADVLRRHGYKPKEKETNGVRVTVWKRPEQLTMDRPND